MLATETTPATAKRGERKGHVVVTGKHVERLRKFLQNIHHLLDVPAGLFHRHDVGMFRHALERSRLDVFPRTPGNVVHHHREIDLIGDRSEMAIQPFL